MINPNYTLLVHTDFLEATPHDLPKVRLLWIVLGLRSFLFLVELVVGLQSHSMSLLAGSGHLFLDLVTMGLTLLVVWLLQRQSNGWSAIDYWKVTAWIGLLNGASLSAIAFLIAWESVKHLQVPEPILGLPMLLVAGISLVINGLSIQLLYEDSHNDLNIRGVLLHGVADATVSVSVILAACAVYLCNWLWADAVGSLVVSVLISLSAISLMQNGWQLLKNVSIQQQEDTHD
ncbi:cation diffusion facilitator family transporter [Pseudanabaena sp. PCC 6802]|uniref:cation diffusion facilitator family transporter n=1 Tax=Pseudanabaena sp. PCC 6802 TaxID=118173 RepID=UPI00034DB588|nr:cation diffusion facilitator family transporter [Pseudanabaena sp. PCC 6802]